MSTVPSQFCSPSCGHVFPKILKYDDETKSYSAECPKCGQPLTVTSDEMETIDTYWEDAAEALAAEV